MSICQAQSTLVHEQRPQWFRFGHGAEILNTLDMPEMCNQYKTRQHQALSMKQLHLPILESKTVSNMRPGRGSQTDSSDADHFCLAVEIGARGNGWTDHCSLAHEI